MFHEVTRLEAREERQGVDVGLRFPDESSELPAPAAMKQGFTSQKCGTKMKDRYLYVVLLVGQVCWEAPPGKDDDVDDHPSEGHNLMFGVMGVIMESIRPSPSDCREKSHARKDCSKFSAWPAGCKRCKTEGASDTGKLECMYLELAGRSRFHGHWRRGGASQGDRN